MLFLRMWNYIRGYVIILVEGYFLEKFMNVCTHRQILLWDIKRQKSCAMYMKVSINGFRLLRPVARKTKCSVRILRKKGLPFLINKYKRRKTFIAGGLLFIFLLYFMTSFVWSIEITGNKELETSYLESVLSSHGIRPGALKYGIDTRKTVSDLMLEIEKLSWISIDVKGTIVKVQLRERIIPPEMVPKDKPCNIVASKEGIISQIIVTDGIEAAASGDTVRKGDLLISGSIPVKNDKEKFRLVHAMGTVKARTWYEEEYPVELEVVEKVKTGREYINYSVVIFNHNFDFLHRKDMYENYDSSEYRKRLTLGVNLAFPFELVENRYTEIKFTTVRVDEETAIRKAAENALKLITETRPENAEVLKTSIKYKDDELEGVKVQVTVECLEEIGITEAIGGN